MNPGDRVRTSHQGSMSAVSLGPAAREDTYPVLDTIEDEIHKRWGRVSYGTCASGANCKPFASSVNPS